MARLAALLAAPWIVWSQHPEGRDPDDVKNPLAGDAKAVEAGRQLYLGSCSGCHGPNAEGGRGPRLAQSRGMGQARDKRLFDTIKEGVRGSDMPPSPHPDEKIWQMVAYVKSLNAAAYQSKAPGDAAAGEAVFAGKGGCAGCHAIGGKGGALGPDLSNAGMDRTLPQLREAVLQPSLRVMEGFSAVRVRTRAGAVIEGVAKDNTNYAIAILDKAGRLHLLNKSALSEVVWRKQSAMPGDYGARLSKQEVNDVIAYLSRQAVRAPAAAGGDQ